MSSNTQAATSTPVHKDFVAKNAPYVESFGEKGAIPLKPGKKLAIGELCDPRISHPGLTDTF